MEAEEIKRAAEVAFAIDERKKELLQAKYKAAEEAELEKWGNPFVRQMKANLVVNLGSGALEGIGNYLGNIADSGSRLGDVLGNIRSAYNATTSGLKSFWQSTFGSSNRAARRGMELLTGLVGTAVNKLPRGWSHDVAEIVGEEFLEIAQDALQEQPDLPLKLPPQQVVDRMIQEAVNKFQQQQEAAKQQGKQVLPPRQKKGKQNLLGGPLGRLPPAFLQMINYYPGLLQNGVFVDPEERFGLIADNPWEGQIFLSKNRENDQQMVNDFNTWVLQRQ